MGTQLSNGRSLLQLSIRVDPGLPCSLMNLLDSCGVHIWKGWLQGFKAMVPTCWYQKEVSPLGAGGKGLIPVKVGSGC